ncbi:MAG TPA: nitroreductase family protein [Candidatus Binatia bacterium]|nr:nitroreductase family protein [Candidatus Binatia bacterium]
MANEVFEAARTVLAVREFADRPVPDDVIRRVVEAGRLSASSMNLQPWHFVVVRDRERLQELGRLVKTGPYNAQAAFAVVAAYQRSSRFGVSDLSRAIQTMMLTAWADGVGSNWTGFGGLDGVREYVGLDPSYEVLAVVPFGYPARRVGLGKKNRKPVGEVASLERAGSPFA